MAGWGAATRSLELEMMAMSDGRRSRTATARAERKRDERGRRDMVVRV